MRVRSVDLKTQSQKTVPTFKNLRMAEREPMHWRLTYTYEVDGSTYIVDGVTRDFCKIGCGIRGIIMPPLGSTTRLKLYLPTQKLPISLDAKITWVKGDCFGVRFSGMDKRDYMRVGQYLRSALQMVG
jgi:hypothetical protein